MSGKKQLPTAKTTSSTSEAPINSVNTIPPRYQPPPIPANQGILKHPGSKDAPQKHYMPKYPDQNLNSAVKYFPSVGQQQQQKSYYPVQYPTQSIPVVRSVDDNTRITQVQFHNPDSGGRGVTRQLDDGGVIITSQANNSNGPIGLPQQNLPQTNQDLRPHRPHRYEEELHRTEMLKFVRKPDDPRIMPASVPHQTRQMQSLIHELRALKEQNQIIADDNQELRDLCCFLDDDRQKGRKLAREWQRFGRYTATVMRQEVSAYQTKLRELESKQQELIKDNLELKELCLYLDEERGNAICQTCGGTSAVTVNLRDDGDGSSSSTNADEPGVPQQFTTNGPRRSASRERLLNENLARQRSTFNDQIMQYVKSLEQRVKQLEEDKRSLTQKLNEASPINDDTMLPDTQNGGFTGRPEAVIRALQVLEVREQLEREARSPEPSGENNTDGLIMDDEQKAIIREMSNVAWRALVFDTTSRR